MSRLKEWQLPQTYKVCNCCDCRVLLTGESWAEVFLRLPPKQQRDFPPLVAGRIGGRPYCLQCLRLAHVPGRAAAIAEPPPSWDNAIKIYEG